MMDELIKYGAVCGAVVAIFAFVSKVVLWVDNQKKQDKKISDLEAKHDKDIDDLKEELQVNTYAIMALLKAVQGDKSEVTKAVETIEKHLNKKAHQ